MSGGIGKGILTQLRHLLSIFSDWLINNVPEISRKIPWHESELILHETIQWYKVPYI